MIVVRMSIPILEGEVFEGQKLALDLPNIVGAPKLASGEKAAAVVAYDGHETKLVYFDHNGRRSESTIQQSYRLPTHAAMSRDDTKIAVAVEGQVQIFHAVPGTGIVAMSTVVITPDRYQPKLANTCIQRVQFSLDSKRLVSAAQVCERQQRDSVYVKVHDVSGDLAPGQLSMMTTRLTVSPPYRTWIKFQSRH
jgi:hypothetical protein